MNCHAIAAHAASLSAFHRRFASLKTNFARALYLFLAVAACSSGAKQESPPTREGIAECESYVELLSACYARVSPSAPETTAEERAKLRARFTSAAQDDVARERVRAKCSAGQRALASSCGGRQGGAT